MLLLFFIFFMVYGVWCMVYGVYAVSDEFSAVYGVNEAIIMLFLSLKHAVY